MQIEEAVEPGVCYIASISPVTINHMKKMVKLWQSSVQDMIETNVKLLIVLHSKLVFLVDFIYILKKYFLFTKFFIVKL